MKKEVLTQSMWEEAEGVSSSGSMVTRRGPGAAAPAVTRCCSFAPFGPVAEKWISFERLFNRRSTGWEELCPLKDC